MFLIKLIPNTKAGRETLGDQTIFWYPLKINNNMLSSVNIAKKTDFRRLESKWLDAGHIIIAYELGDFVIFIYNGTVGDKKVIPLFNEKPLLVKDGTINYFIPKDEFFDEIYPKINKYIDDLKFYKYNYNKELYKKFQNAADGVEKCIIFFRDYFQPDWMIEIKRVKEDEGLYCTSAIGLNPILNLISILPDHMGINKDEKELFSYLLKNDFLVKWIDINKVENVNVSEVASKIMLKNTTENELSLMINSIVTKLYYSNNFFKILYLLTNSCDARSALNLFRFLFILLPKKEKEYIDFPIFQPKIIINNVEMHLILSGNDGAIIKMKNELSDNIFEEGVRPIRIKKDKFNEKIWRYRFICKLNIRLDYLRLPEFVVRISEAIKTLTEENKLKQEKMEMWIRKLRLQIITPPQFEQDVLDSLNNVNPLIPQILENRIIEIDEKEKVGIINADYVCDYKIHEKEKYLFDDEYTYDFQRSYAILNKSLEKKGFKNNTIQ